MDAVSFEEANLVSVLANGWEPGSLLFRGIRVLDGRPFRPGEPDAAMLGRVLGLNLGKRSATRSRSRASRSGSSGSSRATACSRTAA